MGRNVTKPLRKAVLCGLSNYTKLPRLRHVSNDIVHMRNALIRTGFELNESLMIAQERKHGAGFADWLAAAFGASPSDSVLLLHLSGHGTRVDQQWVFCFEDFDPSNVENQTYCCMTQEQFEFFALNRLVDARLVIISIDTCNDHLKGHSFRLGTVVANPRQQPRMKGTLVLVFGSEAGETVSSTKGRGGHFTRAWAEAIDPINWPRTLDEAISFARKRTLILCLDSNSDPQGVNAVPSRHDPESMKMPIFDHHTLAATPTIASDTTADTEPTDTPEFPYVDLHVEDGTLLRLIQSMEPDIWPMAVEQELLTLLSHRLEQLSKELQLINSPSPNDSN